MATKAEQQAAATAAAALKPVSILPKMTLKDMGCNGKAGALLRSFDERVYLARILGKASAVKTIKRSDPETGNVNTYEQLNGDFRGRNLETGERFRSAVLYLPAGIHEMIAVPIAEAQANGEVAEVLFGFDLYARKAENAAGYGYGAEILTEPQTDDVVSQLEATIEKSKQAQLAAPDAE